METRHTPVVIVLALFGTLLLAGAITASPAVADKIHKVDCDKGKTINDALKHADP